jgi:uncharacterized protein YjbI with pentapeptide repeats
VILLIHMLCCKIKWYKQMDDKENIHNNGQRPSVRGNLNQLSDGYKPPIKRDIEKRGKLNSDIRKVVLKKSLADNDFSNKDFTTKEFEKGLIDKDLTGCIFNKANFSGVNLSDSDASHSILQEGNFNGANLANTKFIYSDLTKANLKNTRLFGANFRGANLKGADFTGTDMHHAVFKDAKLDGAKFFETKNVPYAIKSKLDENGVYKSAPQVQKDNQVNVAGFKVPAPGQRTPSVDKTHEK